MPLIISTRRSCGPKVVDAVRARHNSEGRGETAVQTVIQRSTRLPRDLAVPSRGVPAVVMVPSDASALKEGT